MGIFSKISPVIEAVAIVAGVLIPVYVSCGIGMFLWDTIGELGAFVLLGLMLLVLILCLLDTEHETKQNQEGGEAL